jgi:hypothetical protein
MHLPCYLTTSERNLEYISGMSTAQPIARVREFHSLLCGHYVYVLGWEASTCGACQIPTDSQNFSVCRYTTSDEKFTDYIHCPKLPGDECRLI